MKREAELFEIDDDLEPVLPDEDTWLVDDERQFELKVGWNDLQPLETSLDPQDELEAVEIPLLTQAETAHYAASVRSRLLDAEQQYVILEERGWLNGRTLNDLKRADTVFIEARNALVEHNLGLVYGEAKKFRWTGRPDDDLVQDGRVVLIVAAEKYDERKGHTFGTYASWWIRQAILRGIEQELRQIRLPAYLGALVAKVGTIERDLANEQPETPTEEQVILRYAQECILNPGALKRKRDHKNHYLGRHVIPASSNTLTGQVETLRRQIGSHLTLDGILKHPRLAEPEHADVREAIAVAMKDVRLVREVRTLEPISLEMPLSGSESGNLTLIDVL